jgi:hypothetical protein
MMVTSQSKARAAPAGTPAKTSNQSTEKGTSDFRAFAEILNPLKSREETQSLKVL